MAQCKMTRDVVGYKGQRYEVRATRPNGELLERFVVGWTDQEDGGSLVAGVKKHPSWRLPRVVDLGED